MCCYCHCYCCYHHLRPYLPDNPKPTLNPRNLRDTVIPFDANRYVTELSIGSVFAVVSRSKQGSSQTITSHVEEWSVLLNWDVLPLLRKITIKGAQITELHQSPITSTRDSCLSHDRKVLQSLNLMAKHIPKDHPFGYFEVHFYGADDTAVALLNDYPHLQAVVRTLWFHDAREDSAFSRRYTTQDFGQSMTHMVNLCDLKITVDRPATADLTSFLPLLGSLTRLESLDLYICGRTVLPSNEDWLLKTTPLIPQSVTKLVCTTTMMEVFQQFGPFENPTFENVRDLTLHIEPTHRDVSLLNLPFNNLHALQVYLCEPDDIRSHQISHIADFTYSNSNTLRKLSLSKLSYNQVADLVQANPNLEELHIGRLETRRLPAFGPSVEYISRLRRLKLLTIGVESINQIRTQKFGELLTRNPLAVDPDYSYVYEPSSCLEKITIKFLPTEEVRKMPSLWMSLPEVSTECYNLSTHSTFHKVVKMFDEVPSIDYHHAPRYLWHDIYTCAAHVVFDVKAISKDLYPGYYAGKYHKRSPGSLSSSPNNSDDDMSY